MKNQNTLTSQTFKIGTGVGEYPAGTKLTDSIFDYAIPSSIIYESQAYPDGFNLTGRELEFGNIITTTNGKTLLINFKNVVCIGG